MKTIALVLVCGTLAGCALFPPNVSDMTTECHGKTKAVQSTDNFSWRFLGFSTNSTRRAECE